MKSSKSKKIISLMIFILFMSVILFRVLEVRDMETIDKYSNGKLIEFSLDENFYDHTVDLEVKLSKAFPKETIIYYTLNGDDPSLASEVYSEKINLPLIVDKVKVYPVKVRGYYNGEFSDIAEKTVIIGKEVDVRYRIPVISLTTDNYNLYDYEHGIFVPDKTYDDFLANGGDPTLDQSVAPTNYSMRTDDWIRNAHIVMIKHNGDKIIDQDIGISVTGGSSAGQEVKSLKLISGEEYDKENTKFNYNFYYTEDDISSYSHQIKFNNMKLRNGGQDMLYTNLRWGVVSQLAKDSNLNGVSNSQRCVVYLNGEYYGIFDMMENYSKYNVAKMFGIQNKDIISDIAGLSEKNGFPLIGLDVLLDNDLTKQENCNKLEDLVDIDQMLQYYAFETMINNVDWPQNNIKFWNTKSLEPGNSFTDGKYRFLLFDIDLSFMNPEDYPWSRNWPEVLERILGNTDAALDNSALKKLFTNELYKNKFITILCDLMNTSFKDENLTKIITDEKEYIASEIPKLKKESKYYYSESYAENFERLSDKLLETALKRTSQVKDFFKSNYNLDKMFTLNLKTHNAVVYWNAIRIFNEFNGMYFTEVPFIIYAQSNPGYEFDYWLVNGEKVYSEQLHINPNVLKGNSVLNVDLNVKKIDCSTLVINEIMAKGSEDWIEIYNPTDKTIELDDYYLSDNENNLYKFNFEQGEILPNSYVTVNCKNNYQLNEFIANFNLNAGEQIFLSKNKKVIDSIFVPESNGRESYGRYKQTNDYRYFMNPTKGISNE